MKERVQGITYLKCLAALMVVFTHTDPLLPEALRCFARVGLIANCLFFYVSGFCLTNIASRFTPWYVKRATRITVPFLILAPFLALSANPLTLAGAQEAVFSLKYHFLPSIAFLYVFYYFIIKITRLETRKFYATVAVILLLWLAYFVTIYDPHTSPLAWLRPNTLTYFLLSMLMGAAAHKRFATQTQAKRRIGLWIATIVFASGAYVLLYLYKPQSITFGYWRSLALPITLLLIHAITSLALALNDKLPRVQIVEATANLSLELYLVQYLAIDAYASLGFPTNLVYMLVSIFALARALQYISGIVVAKIPDASRREPTTSAS